jgi:hypothetical protein
MAGIYTDQHDELGNLLAKASNDEGASLLIPDLQRPFVWTPLQVTRLVDSLIRGWPFGTFLTWKVHKDDPVRALARSFWKTADRTDADAGEPISKKNPPGSFQMVLDGQQRIQSLLFAAVGDGWGFKLYDRDWRAALIEEKPRGRQGVKHWTIGCLCIDLDALLDAYTKTKRVVAIDFTTVLAWVVTGGKQAQSDFVKPSGYPEPLPRTHDDASKGRYIRLSRVWRNAPSAEGIEQEQAESIAEDLLREHDVLDSKRAALVRPMGSLVLNLSRVKKGRVTYLEITEFDEKAYTRETYNDSVVNIFTRLNQAGRVLSREDITFAWLKTGWQADKTGNASAVVCFDKLREALKIQKLDLIDEQIVAGISFLWSAAFGKGIVLSNNDLLKGDLIRPMAADISVNWSVVSNAIENASAAVADRGLLFREHYQSLNALFILWTWQYMADAWLAQNPMKEPQRDGFNKRIGNAIGEFTDRWFVCSQLAGRWASGSADTVAGYAKRLFDCATDIEKVKDSGEVTKRLSAFLETEVKSLESDAEKGLQATQVVRRELVRGYYVALWIWHRLDADRWKYSQIQLRTKARKKLTLEVDHLVSHALWARRLETGLPSGIVDKDEALTMANRIGNCSLLEKNFNVSKSDDILQKFIEQIQEIKDKKPDLDTWMKGLSLTQPFLDPNSASLDDVSKAIDTRDSVIRTELAEFIRGVKSRVDVTI